MVKPQSTTREKANPNSLREAENLGRGRKKESGFHPGIYARACKVDIFISVGSNSEEKI